MTRLLKKISTEIVHQNQRWAYKRDQCTLPDGTATEYFYCEKPGAAMVVPVTDQGKLVLVTQHRYLQDKPSIEFPAGAMPSGETALATATRELFEETGYQAEEMINIGSFEPLNTYFVNPLQIFLARGLTFSGAQHLDPEEAIEVVERRIDEIDEMVYRGQIWDGKTLAAWTLVRPRLVAEAARPRL